MIDETVRGVRRVLPDPEIAAILGVRVSKLVRWEQGKGRPRGKAARRLKALAGVVSELAEVYTDHGSTLWLLRRSNSAGRLCPLNLLEAGRFEEVFALVDGLAGGPRAEG